MVVIQVGGIVSADHQAVFEDGFWVRGNGRLVGGLNEVLRLQPIPADHPDPEQYAIDLAKSYLFELRVLHKGPPEEVELAKLPQWLRFLGGR